MSLSICSFFNQISLKCFICDLQWHKEKCIYKQNITVSSNKFGIIHRTFVYYFTLINIYRYKKGKKRRQNKTRFIDRMTRIAQNPTTWRISLTARRIVRATSGCVRECPCVWRTLPTLGARGHCQEQAQTSSCRDKLTSR